jgi:hypothetical protein
MFRIVHVSLFLSLCCKSTGFLIQMQQLHHRQPLVGQQPSPQVLVPHNLPRRRKPPRDSSVLLFLTPLPDGLGPFQKKSSTVETTIRKLAANAVNKAVLDNLQRLEIDFPPFAGTKSQFEDYDNISQLDANRDWTIQLARSIALEDYTKWLVFADDKECELAFTLTQTRAASFTSIRAACHAVSAPMILPWGSRLASVVERLGGGDGILADASKLDPLDFRKNKKFMLVCQPGNAGPVEDWMNCERLYEASRPPGSTTIMCIVNGALDKVRNGYYPRVFFPALAASVPFYETFQAVFVLKPVSDKGVYGWIFRVYPEPWQVILQTPIKNADGGIASVQERVTLVSQVRPSYTQVVEALLLESKKVERSSLGPRNDKQRR